MDYKPPIFRDRLCPHIFKHSTRIQNRREYFIDYGTPWSFDVTSNENSSKVVFKFLRCLKCTNTNQILRADQPTIPLLRPNKFSKIDWEPCIHTLKQNIRTCKLVSKAISNFKRAAKKSTSKTRDVIVDKIKRIEELKNGMLNEGGLKKVYENECEVANEASIACLQKLAVSGKNILFDNKGLRYKLYNDNYNGGCLSHLPHPHHSEPGYLAFPCGPLMNHLKIQHIQTGNDKDKYEKEDDEEDVFYQNFTEENRGMRMGRRCLRLEGSDTIHQVSTASPNDVSLCAYRTREEIMLLNLTDDLPIQSTNHTITQSCSIYSSSSSSSSSSFHKPTYVSLSPHIPGEAIFSTSNNEVYLWTNEKCLALPTLSSEPSHIQFTDHNSIVALTTDKEISLFDIRTPPLRASSVLLKTNHKYFFPGEIFTSYYYPSTQSLTHQPLTPRHHIGTTATSLFVLDDRFPSQMSLRWNHMLLTPPTLISVVGVGEREGVIAVGTQEWPEVHCFQLHREADMRDEELQACGSPWNVSKPSDFMTMLSRQGSTSFDSYNDYRLHLPLIGMLQLPHENGFHVLQLSSVGDLMHQDFSWSSDLVTADKTFSTGPGSGHLKVSKRNETIGKHWLSLSSKWYFSNVCNDESSSQKDEEEDEEDEDSDDDDEDNGILMSKSSHVVSLDVSDVFNAKKCHDAPVHPYCSLCNQHPEKINEEEEEEGDSDMEFLSYCKSINNKNEDKSKEFCEACGINVAKSFKLVSNLKKDKLPSNYCDKAVYEGNVAENLINTKKDEYSDDDTKILISSYNGDDDLDELIQQRNVNQRQKHKEVLKMAQEEAEKQMPSTSKKIKLH